MAARPHAADVTILGYGAMELRGPPRPGVADADAGRLLNAVLDGGINLIDTSPDYGRSEELIGRYVGHRRDEFFLASKCGCPLGAAGGRAAALPARLQPGQRPRRRRAVAAAAADGSPRPRPGAHVAEPGHAGGDETVETLHELRDEGKVRFIGMSGILPQLADHLAMDVFDAFQIPYSAVQRDHEDLIAEAAGQGAGMLIRGGAARGAASEEKNWRTGPLTQAAGPRPAELGDLGDRGPARRRAWPRWSSSCASPSATPACRPRSSAPQPGAPSQQHRDSGEGPAPADLYEEAKKRLPQ